jgi:hypothetical protein
LGESLLVEFLRDRLTWQVVAGRVVLYVDPLSDKTLSESLGDSLLGEFLGKEVAR